MLISVIAVPCRVPRAVAGEGQERGARTPWPPLGLFPLGGCSGDEAVCAVLEETDDEEEVGEEKRQARGGVGEGRPAGDIQGGHGTG